MNDIKAFLNSMPQNNPSAKCAVDLALHDLKGKSLGKNIAQLLNLKSPNNIETSFTIAIDQPSKMAERAKESNLPILKIKVGSQNDLEIVKAIRNATKAKIRLDANGGWSLEQAEKIIPRLAEFDIQLIEQPLAKDDIDGLIKLKKKTTIPIFADESFQTEEDLPKLAKVCDGVVIKLMKSGGLLSALSAINTAKKLNLKVMISCMIESSLLVSAAAQLASLCDYVDLDGPLLIQNDRFAGLQYSAEKIFLPNGPGIGVVLK